MSELSPTDSGSTENARLENRKLFKILFKLLYLRFPPLQIRTYVFRTCIFHPPVLSFSVLAFSVAPLIVRFSANSSLPRINFLRHRVLKCARYITRTATVNSRQIPVACCLVQEFDWLTRSSYLHVQGNAWKWFLLICCRRRKNFQIKIENSPYCEIFEPVYCRPTCIA